MPGIRVTERLWWGGDHWFDNDLMPVLRRTASESAGMYAQEIRRKYNLVAGSIASKRAGFRIRIQHSPPGAPPYWQTRNLAESVRITANFSGRRGLTHTIKVRVSTDVPYAPTLEFGGFLSVPHDRKKHTQIRLINPLKTTVSIAPRPTWLPTWNELNRKMADHIASSARAI